MMTERRRKTTQIANFVRSNSAPQEHVHHTLQQPHQLNWLTTLWWQVQRRSYVLHVSARRMTSTNRSGSLGQSMKVTKFKKSLAKVSLDGQWFLKSANPQVLIINPRPPRELVCILRTYSINRLVFVSFPVRRDNKNVSLDIFVSAREHNHYYFPPRTETPRCFMRNETP